MTRMTLMALMTLLGQSSGVHGDHMAQHTGLQVYAALMTLMYLMSIMTLCDPLYVTIMTFSM